MLCKFLFQVLFSKLALQSQFLLITVIQQVDWYSLIADVVEMFSQIIAML